MQHSITTPTARLRADIESLERLKAIREENNEQGSIRGIENDLRRMRRLLAVGSGTVH